MTIEITEKQAEFIRQGLSKLPIEVGLETYLIFDNQVTKQIAEAKKAKEAQQKEQKK